MEPISAKISSQKGFYVGDLCYAISTQLYAQVWGVQNGHGDGVFTDPETGLSFAVAGTVFGDGIYCGSDRSSFCVDSGSIGIVPLELVQIWPGR